MRKPLTVLLVSIHAAVFAASEAAFADDAPAHEAHGAQVVVDPRIELMGVIQLLAGYPLVTSYETLYRRDVEVYFEPFREHAAVTMFAKMSGEAFSFDAVPKAMLALTEPPELAMRVPLPGDVVDRAGGRGRLDAFAAALRDFSRQSNFPAFFAAHRGTFAVLVEGAQETADEAVRVLREYSGMDVAGSTVILGPLLHHGGFAAHFERDGQVEAYALLGPVGAEEGAPTFGTAERIAETAWHEFSHTFVNPLTARHGGEVAAISGLHERVADAMQRNAYPDWSIVVNEHVIRAITTRLAYREQGREAGDRERDKQVKRGFAYLDALLASLENYENARDRYPTFAEFYPVLLAALAAQGAD